MSVVEVTSWAVRCDLCKDTRPPRRVGPGPMGREAAVAEAVQVGWVITPDGHLCRACAQGGVS